MYFNRNNHFLYLDYINGKWQWWIGRFNEYGRLKEVARSNDFEHRNQAAEEGMRYLKHFSQISA